MLGTHPIWALASPPSGPGIVGRKMVHSDSHTLNLASLLFPGTELATLLLCLLPAHLIVSFPPLKPPQLHLPSLALSRASSRIEGLRPGAGVICRVLVPPISQWKLFLRAVLLGFFSPLNHAFFCPYLVVIWRPGSHPGASGGGTAPSCLALLAGTKSSCSSQAPRVATKSAEPWEGS